MEKLQIHINENMIHINDFMLLNEGLITEMFKVDCLYTLDTESCDNNITAWVYAWGISNTENDFVIYGENLNDIYSVFEKIAKAHNKKYNSKKGEVEKFKIFIHNLTWDFEFLKYSLFEMGFELYFGNIKYGYKIGTLQPGTFSITENDGDVYSTNIRLHNTITQTSNRKNKNGEYNTKEIGIELELIDSMKIVNNKLKDIGNDLIVIDDMFKKLDDDYDYTIIRNKGHELTEKEKMYLYNDVYILKEFLKQFYIPLKTNKTTASAISFEKFLEHTFNQGSSTKNYNAFTKVYPDLTGYLNVYDMIKKSYRGGWTQANPKYINQVLKLVNAVSIDINSSYPAVIKYKMLPYGEPVYFEGYPDINEVRNIGYDMELLTIAFDGFANNDEDNFIGEIQVKGRNVNEFNKRASEYVHTNIIGGKKEGDYITDYKLVGSNESTNKRRYTMQIWSFELENMLENMSFYIEDKRYNKKIDMWLSNNKLVKGYDVIGTLCFKGSVGTFERAVDYYTNMKIEGKNTKNKCMEQIAKLILNSFYGKMGSNSVRADRCLKMDDNGQLKYDGVVQSYNTNKKYYTAFASAVTAWARVNLRTTLYKIGYNNVLYFDTDSLYTTITKDEIEKRCGDIINDKDLGKWKVEKHYNEFKAIGAKKYILTTTDNEIVCKCAGLPSDVRETITYEQFNMGASFTGKKQRFAIPGGYVLKEVDFTITDNIYS